MIDYVCRVAPSEGGYVYTCDATSDGIVRRPVGCEHPTPREAIDHALALHQGRSDLASVNRMTDAVVARVDDQAELPLAFHADDEL